LHWASKFSNEQVVQLLLQYHSNVNARNNLHYTPLCGNAEINLSYTFMDRLILFFFVEACFYGNFEIVKILVENGANVNRSENDERSPGMCV